MAAMAEERVQRRLATILAVDVVGYSRLMGVDEADERGLLPGVAVPAVPQVQDRDPRRLGHPHHLLAHRTECAGAAERSTADRAGGGDAAGDRRQGHKHKI